MVKGMSDQTIISIIATNLGAFGANSVIILGLSCSIRSVYFNVPKTSSFSWKLENCKTYCLQQLVRVQEYIRFKHTIFTDLPCDRVVKVACSGQVGSITTDNKIEGSSLVHPTFILEILENVSQDFYGCYLHL